jgi:uncharacterized DUF497 family protein
MAYNQPVRFEWDPGKDTANQAKHGLGFEEAQQLFVSGVDYLEVFDDAHSDDEERFIAIGPIRRGVVVVVWTECADDCLRIISARWATEQEKALFRKYMVRP